MIFSVDTDEGDVETESLSRTVGVLPKLKLNGELGYTAGEKINYLN